MPGDTNPTNCKLDLVFFPVQLGYLVSPDCAAPLAYIYDAGTPVDTMHSPAFCGGHLPFDA